MTAPSQRQGTKLVSELHTHFDKILDATAEGIYGLDLDGRVVFVNRAAERLTGWPRDEQIGRSLHELIRHTRGAGATSHPAGLCPIQATLDGAGQQRVDDELFWRKGGTCFPAAYTSTPLESDDGAMMGVVVTFSDISLRLSERRYRSLVIATSDFVWRCTPDGSLVDISQDWLDLVGLALEQARGWGWLHVVHEADRHVYEHAWQQAVEQERMFDQVYRLYCRDGRVRWFLDRAVPVHDEHDQLVGWVGAGRDISERKEAEEALRESEARFRAIALNLPGGVSRRVMEADGRVWFDYLSPNYESVFGIDVEQALRDPNIMQSVIHPDDWQEYQAALAESARTRAPLDVEFRIRAHADHTRWVRSLGQPRDGANGAVIWDGIAIDETHRKRMEHRLRESQALLQIAGRTARLGGWLADVDDRRMTWSDEVCAIHDMPPGSSPTMQEAVAFYAPEWQTRIRQDFETCLHEGTPFDDEMEIITAHHRRVWVRTIGEPVRGPGGSIIQIRGAFQDISEQKSAQAEVHRLATRLTNTLESITDAFYMLDREWRFTYLNREAERLLQRGRAELLGTSIWAALDDIRGTRLERKYRRAMREQKPVSFEFFNPAVAAWFDFNAYPLDEGLAVYFRDVTERKRAQREIEFLTTYDTLTDLPNRRRLLDTLERVLKSTGRSGCHGAVMFLDLDDFKTLNDTLGHVLGDRLLRQVAGRLAGCVRSSDTVARFGGDEFAVILDGLRGDCRETTAQAKRLGEKIQAALSQPYRLDGHERQISVSIGITVLGDAEDTVDDLMKRADLALYQAKEAGRSSVRVFDPAMRAAMDSRVALETALRDALSRRAVTPWYQPQVDRAGWLVGAEALARWQDPEHGEVSPREFIPVAEATGLIFPLGEAVLESVCERLAFWARQPERAHLTVAVNVSARQFHHPDFVSSVHAIIARTGAPAHRLRLELTESLLLTDVDDTIAKMSALQASGVRFALDDFGTGYSSLSYLKRLPLDQLKIDPEFVQNALDDRNDAAIVRTIIGLAQILELEVIAEGVETPAARELLAEYGCLAYQGHLFGQPMTAERFERFAEEQRVGSL